MDTFPTRPCLELHEVEAVIHNQDGVRVTVFDYGDGSAHFYVALQDQVLARCGAHRCREGGFQAHRVVTHPRLGCPDTVLEALTQAIADYGEVRLAA